ncbi:premnaspirodiene oxygenase-like [Lycium barbarum]|uniref:premnaspirodiene oxygenase-like n=1 Tax=Lycium barbarum TaxID=112863 RepID=UPI00293F5410|nr:premnaspirodiene oxygenase-like [Lycium barbarum]
MEIYQFFNYVALIFLSIFLLLIRKWKAQKLKLPPGPWKLPFIGSLHHLALAGPLPHHGLTNLAKRYGPLMHLQLGEVLMIVISSPRMAKEVLKTHDLIFATRPKLTYADIVHYNSTDVVFSPYGAYWRQIRKICVLELLSAKMVNNFVSSICQDELLNMISSIRFKSDLPVNLTEKIIWFTSSVTCRSALGKICNEHQEKLIYLMKEILSLSIAVNLADFFPKWKFLHDLGGSKSRLLKVHGKVDEILEYVVNEHKLNRANGKKGNGEFGSEDLIDVMLRVRESREQQLPITDENIKAIILDMFSAGSETTTTTINWAFAEMMKNPNVLAKAQAEVRQSLKGKKDFQQIDLDELKYLKLVIKETLRMHPPVPLFVPRECMEETKIDGYNIPLKARVLVNAWAIGRDPESWDDPESFCPERFENSPVDFTGNHHQFIPFSSGRRMCPGMLFGLANVGQLLAQLLYHFDWKLPNGQSHQSLDMTESPGVSATRKDDLILIATPYDS